MEKINSHNNEYENIRKKFLFSEDKWQTTLLDFEQINRELLLEDKEKEILLKKFCILVRSGKIYQTEDLIQAIKQKPEVYKSSNKPDLHTILQNYLDQKKLKDKEPWEKAKRQENMPLIIEKNLLGGKYYLSKLFTKSQISENGLALNTCIGEDSLERYFDKSLNEKIEILSIIDSNFIPLVTIIYDSEKKEIIQIRKKDNKKIDGTEEFYEAVLEGIKFLVSEASYDYQGKLEKRKVKRVYDLEDITTEHPVLLNSRGEIIQFDFDKDYSNAEILGGTRIKVTENLSLDRLNRIAQNLSVDLDMTLATKLQKDSLISIKGSLVDDSEEISSYKILEIVEGGVYLNFSTKVQLNSLKRISGKLMANGCKELEMVNLEEVGSRVEINRAEILILGNLKYIGGILKVENCRQLQLPSLKKTGYSIFANSSTEIELDQFEGTDGVLYANNAQKIILPKLNKKFKVISTKMPIIEAPEGFIEL